MLCGEERIGVIVAGLLALPRASYAQLWRADQGDGTYRNPVLFGDYPGPDTISVGQYLYSACRSNPRQQLCRMAGDKIPQAAKTNSAPG